MNEKKRYRVGEAAGYFGISPDLVRHYEKIGLVSASGIGINGYRQYSFEDLIKLNYVRVLRDLDLGLDEIGELVERRDLLGQTLRLSEYLLSIDEQIRHLEAVRRRVESYKNAVDTVVHRLDSFEIIESPRIVYCIPEDSEDDLFMTRARRFFSESSDIRGGTYSILIRKELFSELSSDRFLIPAYSGSFLGATPIELPPRHALFHASRCVHGFFSSRVRITPNDLAPFISFMRSEKCSPTGDAICQYIAFEKKDDGFVDYIEIWIPITSN